MRRLESFTAEPDIAIARAEMAEWYRGHSVASLRESLRETSWAPGAHEAIRRLQGAGILVAVASYTWKFAVEWFAQELNVRHYLGTDLSPEGRILHVWSRDKGHWLVALASKEGVPQERTAAVGDSLGDADMFQVAGLRIFVGAQLSDGIGEVIHMPQADLRDVADRILDAWRY
jgi:phosphoserine phosphatase